MVKKQNKRSNVNKKVIDDKLSITKIQTTLVNDQSILGPKRIRLGICCKNNFLRSQKDTIFCSRSLTVATYLASGPELAKEK